VSIGGYQLRATRRLLSLSQSIQQAAVAGEEVAERS